ncbi:MAG: WD40 repeat domain-containing protein, partial [Tolypothrix sp. Co-bin9]|nr:WD40 repeat domain-containing protein [Tolypothrix sp. Co-bin9]
MRSEGKGRGGIFLQPYILVAFATAVALPVTFWEGFYVRAADVPVEVIPSQASQNFANPELLYSFSGHAGTIKSLAFSPDSNVVVSGGAENEGVILLWNTQNGKKAGTIRKAHKTSVESLLISPDGKTLVSCGADNTI